MIHTKKIVEMVNMRRDQLGLSQGELADRAKCSRTTMQGFLSCKSGLSSQTLQRVFRVLGISLTAGK